MQTEDHTPSLSDAPFEELAHRAMSKYQTLFDSNMMGIASTDFKDKILSANEAFLSMIGYTQEDLRSGSLTWSKISPSKFNDADVEKINELLANKTIVPFEKEYVHKLGHAVPVLVGAEAIDASLSLGVCFAVDISKLKLLEKKKDDFIGMVSHELKTPLSIMKLYSDFLETSINENGSREELLESAREISAQVDKFSVLISDLLNMARYSETEPVFPMGAIELKDTTKEVLSELSLINDRNIIFQGEKAVYVNGNKERLSQVIVNLVNNAVRYSNKESDIIVRIHKTDARACIEVQDFGMGISPQNLEKIFERYYRINHADDYGDKGAGIGLYISREIITHHKGEITVQSEVGSGSTFTISLPLIT